MKASRWIGLGLAVMVILAAVLIYLAAAGDEDDGGDKEQERSGAGGIQVSDPWVRVPVPAAGGMAGMTAAYMAITNDSSAEDRLLSVTSDVAGRVEIHETTMVNDVAQMRPLADGLVIGAGQTVALEPGGIHLMLMDLNTDLTPGMTVSLILNFSSGAPITVNAPVRDMEE